MAQLAPYPSTQTRNSLPPSQTLSLYETVNKALRLALRLPPAKLEVPASSAFVASYARDAAQQVLGSLIWETDIKPSSTEQHIRRLALQLAENLASSTTLAADDKGLDLRILLDLSVAFAKPHAKKLRSIVQAATRTSPRIIQDIENDLVPSFTMLLSADQKSPSYGLYAIRKTAHTLLSFVRVSPPEAVRLFAYNKEFMVALASMYADGLAAIATGYGGLSVLRTAIPTEASAPFREPDDWERIWVSTKVAFIDAFYTIFGCILDDLASSTGHQLGITSERAFNVMFALLELRPSSSQQVPSTPFLNLPLLADYQRTYNLSHTLMMSLRHAEERDSRLDILESTLQALDAPSEHSRSSSKNPGALKVLLRSSGLAQTVPYTSKTIHDHQSQQRPSSRAAGKAKEVVFEDEPEVELDVKVTQVLDIFPSHSPPYIRLLLAYPLYAHSTEKVIEALLEGTAPDEESLVSVSESAVEAGSREMPDAPEEDDIVRMVRERRNVFDNDILDVSKLRIGKKEDDSKTLFTDRAHIDRMKANILHRMQVMALEDAEDEEFEAQMSTAATSSSGKGKEKVMKAVQGDEVELDGLTCVKVVGDGESDEESDESSEDGDSEQPPAVETILELAYIRDPKLFSRDGATRRSKARADLKAETGWADEQIEGWRIMLERNVSEWTTCPETNNNVYSSQGKTRYSRNTGSLETRIGYLYKILLLLKEAAEGGAEADVVAVEVVVAVEAEAEGRAVTTQREGVY
ncbi:hypothetical protein APHAL10511_007317 [Amanita phalloides]|nr:hypothetical protein APHAL10511_007317 [Amanita phalloides]